MEITNFSVVRKVLHFMILQSHYMYMYSLLLLGNKPKKFDFVYSLGGLRRLGTRLR